MEHWCDYGVTWCGPYDLIVHIACDPKTDYTLKPPFVHMTCTGRPERLFGLGL